MGGSVVKSMPFFQKTKVQFLALMLAILKSHITPAAGHLGPSSCFQGPLHMRGMYTRPHKLVLIEI